MPAYERISRVSAAERRWAAGERRKEWRRTCALRVKVAACHSWTRKQPPGGGRAGQSENAERWRHRDGALPLDALTRGTPLRPLPPHGTPGVPDVYFAFAEIVIARWTIFAQPARSRATRSERNVRQFSNRRKFERSVVVCGEGGHSSWRPRARAPHKHARMHATDSRAGRTKNLTDEAEGYSRSAHRGSGVRAPPLHAIVGEGAGRPCL